jgi:hypothetical protein
VTKEITSNEKQVMRNFNGETTDRNIYMNNWEQNPDRNKKGICSNFRSLLEQLSSYNASPVYGELFCRMQD